MIYKISGQLSTVSRMQKYFRTRENRNFSTVRSTERRVFNFSMIEVCMMVGMAGLQVLVVRFFFQGARKGESSTQCVQKLHPLTPWPQDMYKLRECRSSYTIMRNKSQLHHHNACFMFIALAQTRLSDRQQRPAYAIKRQECTSAFRPLHVYTAPNLHPSALTDA